MNTSSDPHSPGGASPFTVVADGLLVSVRLTPRGSANKIQGQAETADGKAALKIMVTAVPEDGKANAALVELLARQWRLAKRDVTLVAGSTDRRKTIHLAGDPERLLRLVGGDR